MTFDPVQGDLRRIIEEVAEFIINGLNKNTKIVLNKRIPVKSSSSYVLSVSIYAVTVSNSF